MTVGNANPVLHRLDEDDSARLNRLTAAVAGVVKQLDGQSNDINEVYKELILLRKEVRTLLELPDAYARAVAKAKAEEAARSKELAKVINTSAQ